MVVSKAVTGPVEQVLARMGPGNFFGEMSLFDRAPRSATVQADSDASLLALDRERLQELIDVNPRAGALLMHDARARFEALEGEIRLFGSGMLAYVG